MIPLNKAQQADRDKYAEIQADRQAAVLALRRESIMTQLAAGVFASGAALEQGDIAHLRAIADAIMKGAK